MTYRNRLVIFDVEGVIIPKYSFLFFLVIENANLKKFVTSLFFGILYEIGFIPLKVASSKIYRLLKGMPYDRYIQIFREVPLMPMIGETFKALKEAGFRIALISSGLPRIILKEMAERLGADYIVGFELEIIDKYISGEISGEVLEPKGKATVLKKIIQKENLQQSDIVVVADDRNNLPMFSICNLCIGYNPDFILSFKSNYVVRGEITEILPIIRNEKIKERKFELRKNDIIRETIHLNGFLIP